LLSFGILNSETPRFREIRLDTGCVFAGTDGNIPIQ
jgi:hypothetical protein